MTRAAIINGTFLLCGHKLFTCFQALSHSCIPINTRTLVDEMPPCGLIQQLTTLNECENLMLIKIIG
jgi:hypothetical protein